LNFRSGIHSVGVASRVREPVRPPVPL
jgi:hypothetical protein